MNSIVSAFVALTWGSTLSLAVTQVLMLLLGILLIALYFSAMKRLPAEPADAV